MGRGRRGGMIAERSRERRARLPLTTDSPSRRLPPTGELKSPPPQTPRVRAELHSDDHAAAAVFDAADWFEQASDEELVDLAEAGWGGDSAADTVAYHFEDDPDKVGDVFAYLERNPTQLSGDPMGFELHVDEKEARAWLQAKRPHLVPWINGDAAFTTPRYKVFEDEVYTDDGRTEEWSVRTLDTDEIVLSYPEKELAIEAAKALEANLTPPEGGDLF